MLNQQQKNYRKWRNNFRMHRQKIFRNVKTEKRVYLTTTIPFLVGNNAAELGT